MISEKEITNKWKALKVMRAMSAIASAKTEEERDKRQEEYRAVWEKYGNKSGLDRRC